METFFRATSPDDRWVIQVLVENDSRFECKVILDGRHVVEELNTEDSEEMARWAIRQMKEAARRVKSA